MTEDVFKIDYPNGNTKEFPTREDALAYVEAEIIAWKPLTDILEQYKSDWTGARYEVEGGNIREISSYAFANALVRMRGKIKGGKFDLNEPEVLPPPSQSIFGELILSFTNMGLFSEALSSYFMYIALSLEPEFVSVKFTPFTLYPKRYAIDFEQGSQLLNTTIVIKALVSDNEKSRRLSDIVGEAYGHERELRQTLVKKQNQIMRQGIKDAGFRKKANDTLQTIKAEFYEHMRFKAPVKLWENRATEHRQKAKTAQWTFIGLAAAAIAFCLAFPYYAGDYIAATFVTQICSQADPADCTRAFSPKGPLTVSALLLLLSVLLWVIRLQYRLFLSERHLTLDAEEKKAFAETYLALRKDDQVTSDSEAIVLASLFRPTQDGIIKDDEGTMDFSTAAVWAKALGKNA
ncbi:MAG: DUF6161 domain-containing protein [Planktomarina sp.]